MDTTFNLIKLTATLDMNAPDGINYTEQAYGEAKETAKSIAFGKTNISKDKYMVAATTSTSTVNNMFSHIYCAEEKREEAKEMLKKHLLSQYFTQMQGVIGTHMAIRSLLKTYAEPLVAESLSNEISVLKGQADMIISGQ